MFDAVVESLARGVSPCCVLVDDVGGPLAHEYRWHARRAPWGDMLADANESALLLERVAFDALHKDVRALPVLAVLATLRCLFVGLNTRASV